MDRFSPTGPRQVNRCFCVQTRKSFWTADHGRVAARGAADKGPGVEIALGNVTGERRAYVRIRQVRLGLLKRDFHLLDLRAQRFELRRRHVLADLRIVQILLRDELILDQRLHDAKPGHELSMGN